jgi:hypothetical protein
MDPHLVDEPGPDELPADVRAPITVTPLSQAAALAPASAASIPSTNVYTPPSGMSSGASWETTKTGRRAGPVGPSATHHGTERS